MRSLSLPGCVLIVAGVVSLAMEYMVFDETRAILQTAPLKSMMTEDRALPLATIIGVLALAAGLLLLYFSRSPKSGNASRSAAAPARGRRRF